MRRTGGTACTQGRPSPERSSHRPYPLPDMPQHVARNVNGGIPYRMASKNRYDRGFTANDAGTWQRRTRIASSNYTPIHRRLQTPGQGRSSDSFPFRSLPGTRRHQWRDSETLILRPRGHRRGTYSSGNCRRFARRSLFIPLQRSHARPGKPLHGKYTTIIRSSASPPQKNMQEPLTPPPIPENPLHRAESPRSRTVRMENYDIFAYR